MSTWPVDLHAEHNPAFYQDAQPIELPELSWRDVEDAACDVDTHEAAAPAQEPAETPEEKVQREEAERAKRIKAAERAFDGTRYDAKLRRWKQLDAGMDRQLKSGKVHYRDLHRVTFAKVISQRNDLLHRSAVRVQQYEDKGSPKKTLANRIDFLVDVANVGKKALANSPILSRIFQREALDNEMEHWADVPADVRIPIEHRVGWWFIRAGLYPANRYWS